MTGSRYEPVEEARVELGVSIVGLWLDYVALGGSLSAAQLGGFLSGAEQVSDHDYDMLVHAVNERFLDRAGNHPLLYAEGLPPTH